MCLTPERESLFLERKKPFQIHSGSSSGYEDYDFEISENLTANFQTLKVLEKIQTPFFFSFYADGSSVKLSREQL